MTYIRIVMMGGWLLGSVACQDLTGSQTLGTQVLPGTIQNADGAYKMATSATASLQKGFAEYIIASGVLTDELQSNGRGGIQTALDADALTLLDARILTTDVAQLYTALHNVRSTVSQAVGGLRKYVGDSSTAQRGALYAMAAYAEIMLADLYCSGVPLSTWDFEADYTYRPGSTTMEVYQHAIALFDTAMILAADSLPIVQMAQVGKARAQLARGEFAAAGATVADIPANFSFTVPLYTCATLGGTCPSGYTTLNFNPVTASNREGGTSVITWTNPRTRSNRNGVSEYSYEVYYPAKYRRLPATNLVVLASGTEAALIRAEAALQADDIPGWLSILNTLRAASPTTATLPVITDPGEATRADTMFSERAQWLFLTGQRQGDLRRMIRQYSKQAYQVYPTGDYPGGIRAYGNDVTLPIPSSENTNPKFTGCLDRSA